MCLWLCSCSSLHQESHSLHLVPGKLAFCCQILFSFPSGAPLSPLLPSHFTQDCSRTHYSSDSFLLCRLCSVCPKMFAAQNILPQITIQFTSVPSSSIFAKSTFSERSLTTQKYNYSQSRYWPFLHFIFPLQYISWNIPCILYIFFYLASLSSVSLTLM